MESAGRLFQIAISLIGITEEANVLHPTFIAYGSESNRQWEDQLHIVISGKKAGFGATAGEETVSEN